MAEDFFAQETREATAALKNLVKQAGETLRRDTDVRPLIQERPWTSLAAAAAGGVVAGYLMAPPRRSPEEKRQLRERKGKRVHHTAGEILQRQLFGAINPVLRTFATTAAASLFAHGNGQVAHHYDEEMGEPRMQI